MQTRRNSGAVSPNMRTPARKGMTARALTGLVLSVVLPPVGIYFLWRNGVFKVRGRMLVTLASGILCAVMVAVALPGAESAGYLIPGKSVPQAVTPAPEADWSDALSGIEDLLMAEYMANATPAPTVDPQLAIREAEEAAQREAVMDTVVYSVYNGAKYYHAAQKCGETQRNNRELTVREALNMGLGACPRCNPPVP